MDYFWNENTIKNKVNRLRDLYNKTSSFEEKRNIMEQINYINNFNRHISANYRQPKLLEAYIEIKKYIESEKFSVDYLKKFYNIVKGNYEFITPEGNKISNDEIVSMMYDFYNTMPDKLKEAFINNFEKIKTHVKFENPGSYDYAYGYTITIPSIKENFMSIQKCGGVSDIFTAIHEMGHSIFSDLNLKSKFSINGYKLELFPETLELIAGDYLEKYYGDDARKIITGSHGLRIIENNSWINFMNLLQLEREFGGKYKSAKDIINAGEIAGYSRNEVSSICNLEMFPEMHEQLSYIFAIELYYLYKEDPEKFEDVIIKISNFNNDDAVDTINYIETLGIIPNKHSNEFHNSMKEESKILVKKYK